MAGIKEFSTADLNTISRINTVSNTIEKINGVLVAAGAAFTGLLDTYTGAAAAYSTRKLKTGVTVAARIRRSGDDIEADVEFDSNNEISLTSPISNASSGTYTDLADFVDHSTTPRDAFVDEWKDQSGSGNHATQSTLTSQPKLYDATTGLITENGKPALDWDGTDDVLITTYTPTVTHTAFFVQVPTANTTGHAYASDRTGSNRMWVAAATDNTLRIYRGGSVSFSEGSTLSGQFLGYALNKATVTDIRLGVDGSNVAVSGNIGSGYINNLRLGAEPESSFYGDSRIQEFVIYDSDNSSNKSGIEENINSDYLIYQPTDAPTSGLLATYTGAAAAYSVRQLSDKAVIAMRIRRDSDDVERNIGFDANGDLDTTAISDFCGTANGYVTRWWDQSTNGNHADQATDASQPQIYNGTAVITENGKPALDFDGSDDELVKSAVNFGSTLTFTTVVRERSVGGVDPIFGDDVRFYNSHEFAGSGNTLLFAGTVATASGNGGAVQNLYFGTVDSGTGNVWRNGSQVITSASVGSNTITDLTIADDTTVQQGDIILQELIFWESNQTSPTDNRTGIESNVNGYFSIY